MRGGRARSTPACAGAQPLYARGCRGWGRSMARSKNVARVAAVATLLALTGCVSDQQSATGTATTADKGCASLTDNRRALVRQLDAVESGRASASSMGALLVLGAVAGGPSPYPALSDQNAAALAS